MPGASALERGMGDEYGVDTAAVSPPKERSGPLPETGGCNAAPYATRSPRRHSSSIPATARMSAKTPAAPFRWRSCSRPKRSGSSKASHKKSSARLPADREDPLGLLQMRRLYLRRSPPGSTVRNVRGGTIPLGCSRPCISGPAQAALGRAARGRPALRDPACQHASLLISGIGQTITAAQIASAIEQPAKYFGIERIGIGAMAQSNEHTITCGNGKSPQTADAESNE